MLGLYGIFIKGYWALHIEVLSTVNKVYTLTCQGMGGCCIKTLGAMHVLYWCLDSSGNDVHLQITAACTLVGSVDIRIR